MRKLTSWVTLTAITVISAAPALAQAPATPSKTWAGNFAGGLALTRGNSDTKNFNLSFGLVRDPKTRNVIKLNGLYLRGDKDKDAIIDRTSFLGRDEYTFTGRLFGFGQAEYLRDKFKDIPLFPITEIEPGGWDKANDRFFAEGAEFDRIYAREKK